MEKKIIGDKGEDAAVNHLLEKRYELLARNWRYKKKEIDIIMKKGNRLVIVEVKTRQYKSIESPTDMIPRKKQRFLIEAADAYVMSKNINLDVRFDLVFVYNKGEEKKINHIEDAFQPNLLF
ncbi:MAG: YraN family protein [Bacteroidota bacterium]